MKDMNREMFVREKQLSYRATFLGAVDRGNVHGVEARFWVPVMQAVDGVTQFSF